MSNRSDNFNRANSSSGLGTPSDGGSAWVQQMGGGSDWGISSNQAYDVYDSGNNLVTLESSEADGEVQVTLATFADQMGICWRVSDASNYWNVRAYSGIGYSLLKRVSGSLTGISDYATSPANGDVIKVVFSGSAIEVFINGVSRITATDSFNATETNHGLWAYAAFGTSARWGDFSFTGSGGGSTYTGSASLQAQTATVSASGTHTAPTYTGSASPTLSVLTIAGSGTQTPPTYSGTVAANTETLAVAGSGTHTAPTYSGSATIQLSTLTTSGSGTATAPTYTGSGTPSLETLVFDGSGSFASGYVGSGSIATQTATVAASGTATAPTYTGSGSASLSAATVSATGTFFAAAANVAGGHCSAFVVHQSTATKFAVAQNLGIACTIQQSTATKFVIDPER